MEAGHGDFQRKTKNCKSNRYPHNQSGAEAQGTIFTMEIYFWEIKERKNMKKQKSFFAGMLTMLLITCLFGSASATRGVFQKEIEYQDIKISLDGVVLDLRDAQGNPVEPFKFGGTNYVPARALAESLGLTVAWDGANSTVVLAHPEALKPTYITRTGERYHYDSQCNGGTYWEVPFSTATGMGLTPCDKCVLKN